MSDPVPASPAPPLALRPYQGQALVFGASAAVLVVEILSLRLVAPYVGLTLEVSTAVIGFALAAIALGAWLGGMLSDLVAPERLLGPVFLASGALVLLVGPAVRLAGEAVEGADASAVLLMAAVAVFGPAALLSAVSPMVVKSRLFSLSQAGTVVGGYSSLGTVGALTGTFVTGFLLVATVPTSRVLFVLGAGLVLIGAALLARAHRRSAAVGATLSLLVGLGAASVAPQPCDVESVYHCARVVPDPDRESGRFLRLGTLNHSYVDLDDPRYLHFPYLRAFAAAVAAARPGADALRALHIGAGAATFPRYLQAVRAGSEQRVIEIDAHVIDLARRELGLRTGAGLTVQIEDGRTAMAAEPAAGRDLVVMDAFSGLSVPWHLTTREAVSEIRRSMVPGGLYLVNVIDYDAARFARAEIATIAEQFASVVLISRASTFEGSGGGNVVILASDAALPTAAIASAVAAQVPDYVVRAGAQVADFVDGAQILTDDFAPVDQLLTSP